MKNPSAIEIMSPVGSYESLAAAMQAGAQSIYFGIDKFNMRARSSAQNFTIDDLQKISDICKAHNIKTYLALNIVIYDEELEEMHNVVDAAKAAQITAVIATDFAVIDYAHSVGMEVHLSTQCNVCNFEAVKYYSQYADVIVLARELNLKQIKDICDKIKQHHVCGPSGKLLRIEIFVHGALCMSISGKCYLSLDSYGEKASANRGACYQLCRRQYTVYDKDREIALDIDGHYIMSPKDLKTIDFLDQILASGVSVLKIEGRGRGADYVKVVTECYRQAVDAYFNNDFTQENINQWNKKLSEVFNRGFCGGYYLGKNNIEWTNLYGNRATKVKEYTGVVTNFFNKSKVVEISIENGNIAVGDELLVTGNTTGAENITVEEIYFDDKPTDNVDKNKRCSIKVPCVLRRNDKVYKMVRPDAFKYNNNN